MFKFFSKLLFLGFIISIGFFVYKNFIENTNFSNISSSISSSSDKFSNHFFSKEEGIKEEYQANYSCNGKVYCSEMESCEEAKFYQRNCPGTKMDGDGDGIPCERQCGW